eukprot:765605-Pelagomonas_calceolata.AAC.1
MRHQILACDPVNLSQFVVDLRTTSRHLGYWNQFTTPDPRVSNSKRLTGAKTGQGGGCLMMCLQLKVG